jgi:hypothetical protein
MSASGDFVSPRVIRVSPLIDIPMALATSERDLPRKLIALRMRSAYGDGPDSLIFSIDLLLLSFNLQPKMLISNFMYYFF